MDTSINHTVGIDIAKDAFAVSSAVGGGTDS